MKKYIYQFTEKGRTAFLQLPKIIRDQIEQKLRYFIESDNPLSFAKSLQDSPKYFRFRIGGYRVIFSQHDQQTFIILLILKVGHRREVYRLKKFPA